MLGCESELVDFISNLQVYYVSDQQEDIKLSRYGREADGGYIVADKSFEVADVVMSYGVAGETSFEEHFLKQYHKDLYAFDCGVNDVFLEPKNLFHFFSQCLATDSSLTKGQQSSGSSASFSQQITLLGLKDKNIFIKMDIEGAEYDGWKGIMPYVQHITGIAMEIHLGKEDRLNKAIQLTSDLNKHFYLLNVHGNNCPKPRHATFANIPGSDDRLPVLLELTYINKNLVDHAVLSTDQTHPSRLDVPNCPEKPELRFDLTLKGECKF